MVHLPPLHLFTLQEPTTLLELFRLQAGLMFLHTFPPNRRKIRLALTLQTLMLQFLRHPARRIALISVSVFFHPFHKFREILLAGFLRFFRGRRWEVYGKKFGDGREAAAEDGKGRVRIEVDMVVVGFSVRNGHESLNQWSEERELREGDMGFDGIPVDAELEDRRVLHLSAPVYALAGLVGVDGGAELFPDSTGWGGGVFNVAPCGEGDESNFRSWWRHFGGLAQGGFLPYRSMPKLGINGLRSESMHEVQSER